MWSFVRYSYSRSCNYRSRAFSVLYFPVGLLYFWSFILDIIGLAFFGPALSSPAFLAPQSKLDGYQSVFTRAFIILRIVLKYIVLSFFFYCKPMSHDLPAEQRGPNITSISLSWSMSRVANVPFLEAHVVGVFTMLERSTHSHHHDHSSSVPATTGKCRLQMVNDLFQRTTPMCTVVYCHRPYVTG